MASATIFESDLLQDPAFDAVLAVPVPVPVIIAGDAVIRDETAGLQNAVATPTPAGDADDNDTSLPLPAAFANRLGVLLAASSGTEVLMGTALSGYNGSNTGTNAFTINPSAGAVITDVGFTDSAGAGLNGLDSGLKTAAGDTILLYTDTSNNNILLGRTGGASGEVAFAAYIEEVGMPITGGKLWLSQYLPLQHGNPNNADDPDVLNLLNKSFIGASQDATFSLAGAPSGQNLFLMFTTANPATYVDGAGHARIAGVSIILTGKDPANQSTGANLSTGDTVNSSQAGGPTTFGTNSQMITEQEGIRFSFVTGARQDFTIPNLDQNEADVEANIDFEAMFGAHTAKFNVVQLQSGKSAQVKVTALSTAAESGAAFIDGYAGDSVVAISAVSVSPTVAGGPAFTGTVSIVGGTAVITGVVAGQTVSYTTTGDHNRVLVENGAALNASGNTHADFDIGGFTLLQATSATLEIGSKMVFEDDGPSLTLSATQPADALTVDETLLGSNATANFADNFGGTSGFGADGAGTGPTAAYALGVSASGADSGLDDVATGANVLLYLEGGQVVGRAGSAAGAIVFVVSVDAAGTVALDQQLAVVHPDAANPDDSVTLASAGLVTLTRTDTIVDRDGDSASANAVINIGQALNFEDDGPSLAFGNLVGTGTVLPQVGFWTGATGADAPGDVDVALTSFTLVQPNGSTFAGTSFSFSEQPLSPDGSGNFLFSGTLTGDFDNNLASPDTLTGFDLTVKADGSYLLDLVQGFNSTVTLSSANGSLDAGGPDPVRTLTIGTASVVFFGVQATTSDTNIVSAIQLGAPDLTEAQVQGGGFAFLGAANMNVSTAGIGISNNNLDGDGAAGIQSGDESFVVNPDAANLTRVKVYIDNSVAGYDTTTEELYYRVFYLDGTTSAQVKVGAADLSAEAGGQVSFQIDGVSGKFMDAVQLTMGKGVIKIPVIEFTESIEALANDVRLGFTATLTDADGDVATSAFTADLSSNEITGSSFDFVLSGTAGARDAFDIALPGARDDYQLTGFDPGVDKLVLLGDAGALVTSIDNTGTDSLVTVTETGGAQTRVTVVGVDIAPTDIVMAA